MAPSTFKKYILVMTAATGDFPGEERCQKKEYPWKRQLRKQQVITESYKKCLGN